MMTNTQGASERGVGDSGSATVHVVDQALSVLKEICERTEPLGVRELSRDLGISKSTVQRLVTSLERTGLIAFDGRSRKYIAGPGVLTLAWRYASRSDLIGASSRIADALATSTGETVSVSTIVGNSRVTVYEAESALPLRFTTGVGRPHSLLLGATSRVLLGLLGDDDRAELLATLEADPNQPRVDLSALEAEVQAAIGVSHAISRGEWIEGAVGLSTPIGRSGRMVATLSIYGPAARITDARIGAMLPELKARAGVIAEAWCDV